VIHPGDRASVFIAEPFVGNDPATLLKGLEGAASGDILLGQISYSKSGKGKGGAGNVAGPVCTAKYPLSYTVPAPPPPAPKPNPSVSTPAAASLVSCVSSQSNSGALPGALGASVDAPPTISVAATAEGTSSPTEAVHQSEQTIEARAATQAAGLPPLEEAFRDLLVSRLEKAEGKAIAIPTATPTGASAEAVMGSASKGTTDTPEAADRNAVAGATVYGVLYDEAARQCGTGGTVKHLPLLQSRLRHTAALALPTFEQLEAHCLSILGDSSATPPALKNDRMLSVVQAAINAADGVIEQIDCQALAAHYGVKLRPQNTSDEAQRKTADGQKQALLHALTVKCRALSALANLEASLPPVKTTTPAAEAQAQAEAHAQAEATNAPDGMALSAGPPPNREVGAGGNAWKRFEECYEELQKWADPEKEEQYTLLNLLHSRRQLHLGCFLKKLRSISASVKKANTVKAGKVVAVTLTPEQAKEARQQLFKELGWVHWMEYERNWNALHVHEAFAFPPF